jgi:hypothetical protein
MNTILNFIGWMPLWAIILYGMHAYIALAIKHMRGLFHQ